MELIICVSCTQTRTHTNTHRHTRTHTQTHTHTHAARTHTCHSLRRAVTRRNKILLRRFTISAQRGTLSQVTKGQRRMKRGRGRKEAWQSYCCLHSKKFGCCVRECGANKISKRKIKIKILRIRRVVCSFEWLLLHFGLLHSALPLPLCPPT